MVCGRVEILELLGDGIAVIVTIISIDTIYHMWKNPPFKDHFQGNKNVFFHIDVLVYWRLQKKTLC